LLSAKELGEYKGNFGIFKRNDKEEQLANLPSYARVEDEFPDWKQRYIGRTGNFTKTTRSYHKRSRKQISEVTFSKLAKVRMECWRQQTKNQ
jgi:DNA (cytosine-5)-methyltransferase 1